MSRPTADGVLVAGLRLAGVTGGAILVLIVVFLMAGAWPALEAIGITRLVTDGGWQPARDAAEGRFGLIPMITGTLATTAGALVLAIPAGLASALFCQAYGPARLVGPYRRLLELLAGIPSVVYGFWGVTALVPLVAAWQPPGASLFSASLVLAIMILPTLALLADSALASVAAEHRLAAAATGLSRWATLAGVLLPAARSGLVTALVLATGRALGETMAVLMVAGNVPQLPASLFDPVRTLTANVALELGYASGAHRSALFVTGLVLMALVTVLMSLAQTVRSRHAVD